MMVVLSAIVELFYRKQNQNKSEDKYNVIF